jgi:hypothetical protein
MHDALIPLDPPYVYHVVSSSSTWSIAILRSGATRRGRFRRSINTSRIYTDRSIHSFVTFPLTHFTYLTLAPWMTLDSVRERHRHLAEHDWKSAAAEYFATNWKDGDVSHGVSIEDNCSLFSVRTCFRSIDGWYPLDG